MSEPKSKASKKPWKIEHDWYIVDANGLLVCKTIPFGTRRKEHAQLIVQAVNSHEVARKMAKLLVSATTDVTRPLTVLDQRRLMQTAGVFARKFQEMDRD